MAAELVGVEEAPGLRPLPPDPLGPVAGPAEEAEPPWLESWLAEQGDADDDEPGHLPSGVLAALDPGAFLAAELEDIDPRTVDEYCLVEMVVGYHRIAAWAHGRMTEVAAQLSRRPALNPRSLPTGDEVMNVTAEELSPRLGLSRFAAKRLVDCGRLFGSTLEDTGEALRRGLIDYPKACTLVRLLKDQPPDVAWEVQQIVLPDAPHQTITQLEKAVAKAIISVDPMRATARHKRAREERRVHHPRPLPDGMASVFAVLPATDAAGLDLALEAAARTAKANGDSRTIDQLRADALALLGSSALERGFIGTPEDQAQDAGEVPDTSVAGPAAPAEPDTQPEDPEAASELSDDAADGAPADDGADGPGPSGGGTPVMDSGNAFLRTPRMPIGTIGGRRAQIAVTVPLSVLVPFCSSEDGHRCPGDRCAHQPPGTGPEASASATAAAGSCAECQELPSLDDVGFPEDWYYGPLVEVAELHGYGPITPDVARALAHSGGTWQRLVTDPLSGELLDVGRSRCRPPAAIADFVRHRDGTCVFPGCSAPAGNAQLDHVVPWEFGGVTSTDNVDSLCPTNHPVKTIGAFQLRHLGGGVFEWTTPTGHHYVRHPSGRVTALGRRAAANEAVSRAGTDPSDSGRPPF